MNGNDEDTLREIETHKLLLEMDEDELYHHLMNPVLFSKFSAAAMNVRTVIQSGEYKWGSIYEQDIPG